MKFTPITPPIKEEDIIAIDLISPIEENGELSIIIPINKSTVHIETPHIAPINNPLELIILEQTKLEINEQKLIIKVDKTEIILSGISTFDIIIEKIKVRIIRDMTIDIVPKINAGIIALFFVIDFCLLDIKIPPYTLIILLKYIRLRRIVLPITILWYHE